MISSQLFYLFCQYLRLSPARGMNTKMNDLSIVATADGSKTIFNPEVGEHYHSKHGALQESKHVFLESGLNFFLQQHPVRQVSVLEVGFGTGLNFLLSADHCSRMHIRLQYTGIEAFPLNEDTIFQTGYEQYVRAELWNRFQNCYRQSFASPADLNEFCNFRIDQCKLLEFHSEQSFDVLYFDAFAAVHQPEMWSAESLEKCTRYLKPGGVFVTYAITGNLKRTMKSLNFEIEKAPGAPGKREMLRAVKKS